MDLRGLDARTLSMLLGGALDINQTKSRELQDQYDREMEMYKLANTPDRLPHVQYSPQHLDAQGKPVIDVITDGKVTGTLPAVPQREPQGAQDPGGRWFQSPDGSQNGYFSSHNPPPGGWTGIADPNTSLLTQIAVQDKQQKQAEKLAGYRTMIETGKDGKGKDLSSEQMKEIVKLHNKANPDSQYKEEITPPATIGGHKVPFTGGSKWVEVPKGAQSIDSSSVGAPPVGTVDSGYKFKGGNPSDPNNWEKM